MTIFTSLITYQTTLVYFVSKISFVDLSRMATAFPQATPHGDDNFVLELNLEKDKVRTTFIELREVLTETEKKLMKALNDILSSYNSYRSEMKKMNERKREIENIRNANLTVVPTFIYVADCFNHCVKVFDNTAKYLLKFGDGKGEGKLSYPRGLLIRGNKVFVSHNHCILVYQLDGKFVSKIGSGGSGELQFNFPCSLSTDECNNDIYICDNGNHRIQIFSENLQYRSQFGKDTLHYPCDIKLYKDNIFILDASNPCLHRYNRDLVLQQSVVIREGQQVRDPCFFFIDKFGNILISDRDSNSILILTSEFEFIHEISVRNPMGITMDREDRIIVVCNSDNECLQIF